jgi:hypothetical protein
MTVKLVTDSTSYIQECYTLITIFLGGDFKRFRYQNCKSGRQFSW